MKLYENECDRKSRRNGTTLLCTNWTVETCLYAWILWHFHSIFIIGCANKSNIFYRIIQQFRKTQRQTCKNYRFCSASGLMIVILLFSFFFSSSSISFVLWQLNFTFGCYVPHTVVSFSIRSSTKESSNQNHREIVVILNLLKWPRLGKNLIGLLLPPELSKPFVKVTNRTET